MALGFEPEKVKKNTIQKKVSKDSYNPKLDKKLYETVNKEFLAGFPEKPLGIPKEATSTCNTHLNQNQTLMFADPKGNGVRDVTWNEPKDKVDMIKRHDRLYYGVFSAGCFIFVLILFYFWGVYLV